MKNYITAFGFLLTIALSSALAQNRTIEFDHGTLSELLAKAKKENKMIYIDCYTSWCGPCKWMAKNVFTNDTVADFYNKNFINAKIDMENGEGIEIAKKYAIRAYPTMLFINAEGIQMHRTCGSSPVKKFIETGENALSPNKQLATYEANFNGGKVKAAFAASYFSMLENACQSYDTELEHYFSFVQENDFRSRSNWEIIFKFVESYYSKAFQTFEMDRISFSKQFGIDSVENKINQVYTSGLYSAIQNKDMKTYESLKSKLRGSNTKDAEKIILKADIRLFERSKDYTKYAQLVTDYITRYSIEDPSELNSFAWAFYEQVDDKTMLQNAAKWAKKATEADDNFAFNDTYAAVLFKLGNKTEARIIAQKAIDIAKKNGEDFKETEALLKKINELK
jgi:thiol-disulfide isomerase/thioredoxin